VIHGSQAVTQDVDICAPFTREIHLRLIAALACALPRFRMSRDLLPLPDEPERLEGFRNLYLVTDLGPPAVPGYTVPNEMIGRSPKII